MNKQLSYLLQHRVRRKKGDTTQLAAQLAPLEEQKRREAQEQRGGSHDHAIQEHGAIVVDNDVRLSTDIMEGGGEAGGRFLGMEPVVLVILAFMLAFIMFIAWQISLMPGPPE